MAHAFNNYFTEAVSEISDKFTVKQRKEYPARLHCLQRSPLPCY